MISISTLGLALVAPLAGSVDRNWTGVPLRISRQAVAPLAGSVDRNPSVWARGHLDDASLPSRGAWIEIRYNVRPWVTP